MPTANNSILLVNMMFVQFRIQSFSFLICISLDTEYFCHIHWWIRTPQKLYEITLQFLQRIKTQLLAQHFQSDQNAQKKGKHPVSDEDRFQNIQDKDLEVLRTNLQNHNTSKANNKCEKVYIAYLRGKEELKETNLDYWLWEVKDLNYWLSKFWFELRTVDGDYYRVSTLKHLHYGMKRLLRNYGHGYDITKSESFVHSQSAFSDTCKMLKKLGYGYVESYKEIKPQGMVFLSKNSV